MTSLLPLPQSVSVADGLFVLRAGMAVEANPDLERVAAWLMTAVGRVGVRLTPASAIGHPRTNRAIGVRLRVAEDLPSEGYRLDVDASGIEISGGGEAGVFYGAQTLLQLLPERVFRAAAVAAAESVSVPFVQIRDEPRFGWRGVLLDVARHFMPKHDLLRFIDLMAMHRLNLLHLHLTDDQGWRVEIASRPRLTEIGGWRVESQVGPPPHSPVNGRPHGGFYTQDDIREIVAYARQRFIEVVPEIDIPGHSRAAIAAYPELGIGVGHDASATPAPPVATTWGVHPEVLNLEDSTVQFFRDVFTEIMDLFPSTYIGLGGDECPTDLWRDDARTQELMRARGIATEDGAREWFVEQIAEHIIARGRRPYGWDELLEGTPSPGTVVASWRGMRGALAGVRRGYDVVACPDDKAYLDYRQSDDPDEPIPFGALLSLRDTYSFEPIPADATPEEARRVLGGQANLWTEHMDSPRTVDYYAFPRLCAIAEVLWTRRRGTFEAFSARLDDHLRRLDALGVEYRRPTGPLPWQRRPEVEGQPLTAEQHAEHVAALVSGIAV
ncbi:beta-N-acetylhexosaminidase [Microbacterium azadirachtae]|uniref:beta-N-acetylhexosaminidase n=1 Tax=Microbacterium azadirachtae TaxID=582680 RepID=UPI003F750606